MGNSGLTVPVGLGRRELSLEMAYMPKVPFRRRAYLRADEAAHPLSVTVVLILKPRQTLRACIGVLVDPW